MSPIRTIIITCQVIISVASFWMNGSMMNFAVRERLVKLQFESAPQPEVHRLAGGYPIVY